MLKLGWQQIASTTITEILCNSFDGVVFDLEHGCFNNETLYSSIQLINALEKYSFVRLTAIDETVIRMCLDAGITGVILSTVETTEQVKSFLDLCLYKRKRGQGLVRENCWGKYPITNELRTRRDQRLKIILQIETCKGIGNIDNIVRDYDNDIFGYLIGPYDLSASLGNPGNFEYPPYKVRVDTLKKAVGNKLGYHIVKDYEQTLDLLPKETSFVGIGLDTLFLIDGAKKAAGILS